MYKDLEVIDRKILTDLACAVATSVGATGCLLYNAFTASRMEMGIAYLASSGFSSAGALYSIWRIKKFLASLREGEISTFETKAQGLRTYILDASYYDYEKDIEYLDSLLSSMTSAKTTEEFEVLNDQLSALANDAYQKALVLYQR